MHRLLLLLSIASCAPAAPPDPEQPPSPPAAAPPASALASGPPAGDPASCGALGCRLFDTEREAFAAVLAERPRVLAVGEAHAQKGSEKIVSATTRFRQALLPETKSLASDLVIELMVAEGDCKPEQQKVAEAQRPVVEKQAESNKSEFVLLGEASDALGIRPHVLRPGCDDYKAVLKAGDDAVPRMLAMIAALSADLIERILERNAKIGADKLVLAYGGALHNDIAPGEGREAWSFGPKLKEITGGRYVELDLIVPEYIKDSDSWRRMPWHAHFDPGAHPDKVTLYQPAPGSFVIIFARSS
jgi:hypothetical protein